MKRIAAVRALTILFLLSVCISFALEISTGPTGSNVQQLHNLGYQGQGIGIGLISQNHTRVTHEAFAGHAQWYDATDLNSYSISDHDTAVGGIICSRGGAAYPNDKGLAPGAELYSVRVVRDLQISFAWIADALNYLHTNNGRVVVTAIQLWSESPGPTTLTPYANGNSEWSLIYDYYAYEYNMIFATAAGNYYSSISIWGDTYNGIAAGGLLINADNIYYRIGSQSNPGLTLDGRQKPDVAAPSQAQWTPQSGSDTFWGEPSPDDSGETSWAVPHIGGAAASLLSYADESLEPADGQNTVIKAVIINSAFGNIQAKNGSGTINFADPRWPWHQHRGYGRLDAYRAYQILSSPKIVPSSSTANQRGWAFDSVNSGQQDNFTIAGQNKERLVVTLTWNRRVQWNDGKFTGTKGIIDPYELESFLANLNLEIYDPDGMLAAASSSAIDNVEKIDVLLSKTGNYTARVVNNSSGESADYALAFELLPWLEADFNTDYIVDSSDLTAFVPHWLSSNCLNPTQPCFEYNLDSNGLLNLGDLAVIAGHWLTFDNRYH